MPDTTNPDDTPGAQLSPLGPPPGDTPGAELSPLGAPPGDTLGAELSPLGAPPGDTLGAELSPLGAPPGDTLGAELSPLGAPPGDTLGAELSPLGAAPDDTLGAELSPLGAAPGAFEDVEVGALSPLVAAPGDGDEFKVGDTPVHSSAAVGDIEAGDGAPKTAADQRFESGEDRAKIRPASWILQLIVWGTFLAFLVFLGTGNGLGAGLLFMFVFLPALYCYGKMCRKSGTREFVANLNPDLSVQAYMQELETTAPIIRFTAVCWHTETHYRTVRDSDGNKRTESYQVTIYTHNAAENYPFTEWEDGTLELSGTDIVPLTKLHLSKEMGFLSDAGRHHWQAAYDTFCNENRRDVHQIFTREFYVPGFKERILCLKEGGEAPWWVGSCPYWIASVLLMNVPYRMLLDWNTGIVRHTIVKNIDATGEGDLIVPDEAVLEALVAELERLKNEEAEAKAQ